MSLPRVMLAVDSLRAGGSGIARVARLVARVLGEEARAGRIEAQALVLADEAPPVDLGLEARNLCGSRLGFVLGVHRAALDHTHFIYDVTGIARAHPRVPPLARPYLVWMHGIEVWEQARADRVRRAQAAVELVANTAYTRERAGKLRPELLRARVCWLATEEDEAPAPAVGRAPKNVLILSRLDAGGGYKGHRELIACFPDVVAAIPEARLVIAGDGPGRDVIAAWVAGSPARDRIELTGFVPDAALEALWRRTRVFAMPSRGEGFGLAYIEAMRQRIPVIGSVHDAASEINVHGETGYNVSLDEPQELTERLVHLLRDDAECERLGHTAHARWAESFRFGAFRTRFGEVLGDFLAR